MYEVTIRGVVVRCLDLESVLRLIDQVKEIEDVAVGHRMQGTGTRVEGKAPRRRATRRQGPRRKQDKPNGSGGEATGASATSVVSVTAAEADRQRVLTVLKPNQHGLTARDLKRLLPDLPGPRRSTALYFLKRDSGVVRRGNTWYHPDHAGS